jgi:chaperonin GroEL
MIPLFQIWRNAGIQEEFWRLNEDSNSYGLNVKTGEWGDMYKMGVIDPLKVTKSALQNAVSVAVTILSTNAIITMARTYEDANL